MGTPFNVNVAADDYEEYWTQEIQVFHNPKALYPMPFEWLLGATHHYFEDGQMKLWTPPDAILNSYTLVVRVA